MSEIPPVSSSENSTAKPIGRKIHTFLLTTLVAPVLCGALHLLSDRMTFHDGIYPNSKVYAWTEYDARYPNLLVGEFKIDSISTPDCLIPGNTSGIKTTSQRALTYLITPFSIEFRVSRFSFPAVANCPE